MSFFLPSGSGYSNIFSFGFHGNIGKSKGKAVSLQACSGPEGSRKLRFPNFVTTAQMVVGCQPYAPAAFTPQEILLVLISVRG